jgi:chromosome segregation ATPase
LGTSFYGNIVPDQSYLSSDLEKQEESYKAQLEDLAVKHSEEVSRAKKQHNEALEKVNKHVEEEKEKVVVLEDEKRGLHLELEAMQLKVNELQEEIKNSDIERERAEFKTKLTTVKQK